MEQIEPLPTQRLIKRNPRIVEPTFVDVLHEAVSPGAPSHCRNRIECCLELERLFRPLALGQIEHERDALLGAFGDERGANKHGNAAAIFPKILLLEGWNDPSRVQE